MTKRVSLLVLVACAWSFGQDGQYQSAGKTEVEAEKVVRSRFEPADEQQKAIHEVVKGYFQLIMDEDLAAAYQMMSEPYKKHVSLTKFIKKDRLAVKKIVINSITLPQETCAISRGYIWGYQAELGSTIRIPFREVFFKEGDAWRVFKNPYTNSMGVNHPFAKRFKPPCEEEPEKEMEPEKKAAEAAAPRN